MHTTKTKYCIYLLCKINQGWTLEIYFICKSVASHGDDVLSGCEIDVCCERQKGCRGTEGMFQTGKGWNCRMKKKRCVKH